MNGFPLTPISARTTATLVATYSRHPLLHEVLRVSKEAQDHGEPFLITSPRLAVGEQILRGLAMLTYQLDPASHSPSTTDELRALGAMVLSAPLYWWPDEIDRDVVKDMPLPRHQIARRSLPHDPMWISWESQSMTGKWPDGKAFAVDNALLRTDADGLLIAVIGEVGNPDEGPAQPFHFFTRIKWGDTYPDDMQYLGQQIIRQLAFLDAPFTAVTTPHLDRATRRELARDGRPEPDVYVIRLREAAHGSVGDGTTTREFHHRWWVRGHFRAQWYPSAQGHRLIWIAPHLKGPEDAPFRQATYAVVR